MNDTAGARKEQVKSYGGMCPYCFSELDVYMDIKGRPYWTCLPCGTRTFATRKAFDALKGTGWIWEDERPLEALRVWLKRIAKLVGFRVKAK